MEKKVMNLGQVSRDILLIVNVPVDLTNVFKITTSCGCTSYEKKEKDGLLVLKIKTLKKIPKQVKSEFIYNTVSAHIIYKGGKEQKIEVNYAVKNDNYSHNGNSKLDTEGSSS